MSGRYRRDGWTDDVMIRICRHRLISMKGSSVNVKNRQQNKQIRYCGRGVLLWICIQTLSAIDN